MILSCFNFQGTKDLTYFNRFSLGILHSSDSVYASQMITKCETWLGKFEPQNGFTPSMVWKFCLLTHEAGHVPRLFHKGFIWNISNETICFSGNILTLHFHSKGLTYVLFYEEIIFFAIWTAFWVIIIRASCELSICLQRHYSHISIFGPPSPFFSSPDSSTNSLMILKFLLIFANFRKRDLPKLITRI